MERGQGRHFSVIGKTGAWRRKRDGSYILAHLQKWVSNPACTFESRMTSESPGWFCCVSPPPPCRGLFKPWSAWLPNPPFIGPPWVSEAEVWRRMTATLISPHHLPRIRFEVGRCVGCWVDAKQTNWRLGHTHMPRPVSLHDVDFHWGFR